MDFEEWMNKYNNALLKETAFKIRNLCLEYGLYVILST